MIDIEKYLELLIDKLRMTFANRLVYVGLLGSYLRGEATSDSDIDIMVVIDTLSVSDLVSYRNIIKSLGNYEKSCGFICSKEDLSCWNPLEICHLVNSTKDYYGELKPLVPAYTDEDIRCFVKLSINNMYHELCHRYIHADLRKNTTSLPGTYKGVFFILQNLYYLQRKEFFGTKAELLRIAGDKDRAVLQRSIELNAGVPYDFQDCFSLLFSWCQETLRSLS